MTRKATTLLPWHTLTARNLGTEILIRPPRQETSHKEPETWRFASYKTIR